MIFALQLAASITLCVASETAPALAASCAEEVQKVAQDYGLPLGPVARGRPGSAGTAAQAPMTNESRGVTAGPDTTNNSGGTVPPAATTRSGPMVRLGAADRAKVEGLLSEARAAAAQDRPDECFRHLRDAEAVADPRKDR